jgi:uncharacterized RDD family membrane protein YckC
MMNDSVREELESVTYRGFARAEAPAQRPPITIEMVELEPETEPVVDTIIEDIPALEAQPMLSEPLFEMIPETAVVNEEPVTPPTAAVPEPPPPPAPRVARVTKPITADLPPKHTSPTLVEFQHRNPALPDWRLELQNKVRQRGVGAAAGSAPASVAAGTQANLSTAGNTALKADARPSADAVEHHNERVASALRRIENSRKAFLPNSEPAADAPRNGSRSFKFDVVGRGNGVVAGRTLTSTAAPKPKLVEPRPRAKFDTNKLPKIADALNGGPAVAPEPEKQPVETPLPAVNVDEPVRTPRGKASTGDLFFDQQQEAVDEIDDLAPLSMRFGAGVFDLIVGLFATLLLLSPIALSGGTWMTAWGGVAVGGAFLLVMFLYSTIAIGFFGRTLGMRLFSLEIIDVEENEYPTLQQSAVSSAVFLLSLAFAGAGFIPALLNEERRAAHDLISGTILVREY